MELEIKRQELHKMYDGSTESMTEVFDAFLGAQHEMMDEINIAFENENENLIRQQLHYHAPVFGYVGFSQVTLFLKTLEDKYKEPTTLTEMRQDHAAVISTLIQVTALLVKEKELIRAAAHA
jgi:HPt (histidine-containing phosphotransfer) domain-containing protein